MDRKLNHTLADLTLIPVLGNLLGALSIFIYLSYIAVDTPLPGFFVRREHLRELFMFVVFMLFATIGMVIFSHIRAAPLRRIVRRTAKGDSAGDISDTLRRQALALPRVLALASAVIWLIAGLFFSRSISNGARFLENFLAITVVAGWPSVVVIYLLLDLSWRRALPIFFPQGNLPDYRTARLSLLNRLRILMPLITYVPLGLSIWIAFDRSRQLWLTQNPFYLRNMLLSQIYLGLLALLVIFLGLYTLGRSIIVPLLGIRMAFDRVGRQRDFTTRLPVVTNDELGELAADFNTMVAQLARGQQAEEERARIAHELDLARRTQLSLLPREAPRLPYLEVAASSEPAFQVGGDLYGYYLLTDQTLAITIGDVSGKGMAAALMMATTTGLIGANISIMRRPADLLDHLNESMRIHTRTTGLNTALCALHFCPAERGVAVEAANAGSVWPILRRTDGTVEWLEIGGPPLGMTLSNLPYPATTRTLHPGDLLILSSDGVIEAQNRQRELFGFERLEATVANLNPDCPALTLHATLLQAVHTFIDGAEPHDDLTLIVLKVVWPEG